MWRRGWFSSIRELSGLSQQKERWGRTSNPHDSFDEYVNSYLHDRGLEEGYGALVEKGLLSSEEAATAEPLHIYLTRYQEPVEGGESAILNDPAWLKVVSVAESARLALLRKLTDNDERALLTPPREKHG